MKNTHLDGTHPNRRVLFLDNSVPLPFLYDPHNPGLTYHAGSSLSANVERKIEEFEPSIIHISVPDLTALHLVEYARARELPLMGTYHSNIPEYMDHYPGVTWLKHIISGFFRHQYNFFQALYVPTPFIHNYLSDTYRMHRITNLRVWGRGIDLEKFSPRHRCQMFRQKLGIQDNEVVVCWVGRLVPEKRPDIFANVLRRLHADGVPFKALVVGSGQYEDEIKSLPNTSFLGWLDGSELSVAYASSDVFLFPSAVETFGNVTLEAAASGLPLVVEAGCSGHLVNDGENGFACVADDEDAFYEATRTLVVDHNTRAAYSKAGREFSMNFEKRAVMRKMVENYSIVTDEFYSDCGGRHVNRDRAFENEDSFWGGRHPRTLSLAIVELLLVGLMRFLWYLVSAFYWLKEIVAVSRQMSRHDRESLDNFNRTVKDTTDCPLTPPLTPVKDDMELGFDDVSLACSPVDDKSSAISSSEGSTPSYSSGPLSCKVNRCPPIASWLSMAFVNFVLFLFRIESAVRTAVQRVRVPDLRAHRKRKNSKMVARSAAYRDRSSDNALTPTNGLERRVRRSTETLIDMQ